MKKENIFRIHAWGDTSGTEIFLRRAEGNINPIRAAIFCEFKVEEWFQPESTLLTAGVATLLVRFYGFIFSEHLHDAKIIDIDWYSWRDRFCPPERYGALMHDTRLHRDEEKMKAVARVLLDCFGRNEIARIENSRLWEPAILVRRISGNVDPVRAAAFCQLKAEEWFGKDAIVSNHGMASMLADFYGFRIFPFDNAISSVSISEWSSWRVLWPVIDMFRVRTSIIRTEELTQDMSLNRIGLKDALRYRLA